MSSRRLLLIIGILAIFAAGTYIAYRLGYFARDGEDPAELAKVRERKLEAAPVADAAGGWPQWLGPTRDGRAPAGAIRTDWDKNPPKLLWKAPCEGGYASCTVVGGLLLTQDYSNGKERVIGLNAEDGEKLWAYEYPADYKNMQYGIGPRATPSIEGRFAFTVGTTGRFLCLEMPTEPKGQPRVAWEHDLIGEFESSVPQWGVACSPLIEGDLVIVQPGGKSGSVVAFDKKSGEVRWRAGSNQSGYSSPVAATIGGQRMIFAFAGDALLVIRPTDGKVMDNYEWKTGNLGNIATPIVVDEYVFISSAYQQGSALLRVEVKGDEARFVQVYARRGRGYQNHHSTSVFKDRHLFGFDGMGGARLKCVSFDTGKEDEDWEAGGIGTGSGTLILAEKHLIILTEKGDLCLVEANPEEFHLVKRMKVLSGNNNWATPTLVDGRLYLRDEEKVVCYDVRP
jgi:outer membrane protein assembly factor BamB